MQKRTDMVLLALLLLIMAAGVVAIYTASATRVGEEFQVRGYYLRQLVFIGVALLLSALLLRTPYRILEIFFLPSYVFTLLLLALVLLFPAIGGSHRWIQLGAFRLQPSELAKLVTVLAAAKLLAKQHLNHTKMFVLAALVCGLPAMLIIIEPDLGTSLTFVGIFFAVLLAAGFPLIYLFIIVSPLVSLITVVSWPFFAVWLLVVLAVLYYNRFSTPINVMIGAFNTFVFLIAPVFWNSLKPYQQNRILTFLDPGRDPLGAGYQILQARIAIGSGGVAGKGFLMGTQKNLDFLPERHTDFIFSVIGEEFGFIGVLLLVSLIVLLLWRITSIIMKLQLREHQIVATGVLGFLAFQALVNIGMNLGVMPTTGLPLPFISYGGSSLLVNTLGVIMVVKARQEVSTFR